MHRFSIAVAVIALATVPFSVSGGGASASTGSESPTGFLTGPNSGEAVDIAVGYLRANAQQLGVGQLDLADVEVTDAFRDAHNGVTHVYVRQRHNGLAVFNGVANVSIANDGSVITVGNRLVPNLAAAAPAAPLRTPSQAVADAARALGLPLTSAIVPVEVKGGAAQEVVFEAAGLSADPIPVKLVYQPVASGVRLAWNVEIYERSELHWWTANVDAATGDLLLEDDYIDDSDGAKYNVFALPKDSPNDGDRTLESDRHDSLASPFAWHDTNGVAGPESTQTQGNNVRAYTDRDANNSPDAGTVGLGFANGGAALLFDFPFDPVLQPDDYQAAAVTNLFYFNNIIHDVVYRYGFTEAAGNFQTSNYNRGGFAGDAVRAEAQDGSALNNANFATPPDGSSTVSVPRMQMFQWRSPAQVSVHAPASVVGEYEAGSAGFGPVLTRTGVTGDIVAANDNEGASSTDGCEAIDGFPAGKIALVDRGNCTFALKTKNAQDAGAIAAVIVNNIDGPPPGMAASGDAALDNSITIPAVSVTNVDGARFRANLPVNATLRAVSDLRRDSDLDNGVIAHEYGHGISNRLTGGPQNTSCLNSTVDAEQMGEGWSDFLALVLTANPSHAATTPRGIGTYVSFQPGTGPGIRPTPYTTDMRVNPSTYDTIKQPTITVPHGVGYVWATMLWEVYWNLVEKHGFNPDIYGDWRTGGNNLALQLVIDGMKLQPCLPGFVDGRDAILEADQVLTGGDNECLIWRGFAKRGLGTSASQGLFALRDDALQKQAFDLPAECNANIAVSPASISSNVVRGASDTKTVTIRNTGANGAVPVSWTITEAAGDCSTPTELAWVSATPASGSTDGGATSEVTVKLDSTAVPPGVHNGVLCVKSNDADTPTVTIPLTFDVDYAFSGFFGGVMNPPALNAAKAGKPVNVIFSLAGNWGSSIFATGHPQSRQVDCITLAAVGVAMPTTAWQPLVYDAATDRYKYAWGTSTAWAGTCRELRLALNDGTPARVAYFSFTK